ncbi:MAG: DUF1489 family protein [Rhodobacteraceae bacterium]|nr:DUF1489 family protein [Paracoccaceae bacterium]
MTLHLLMNFPPWNNDRRTSFDSFMTAFPKWEALGWDYALFMRHRPRRESELLPGGSVYCRWGGQILWRMPITGFMPVQEWNPDIGARWHAHTAVLLSCAVRMVRPTSAGFMRGFRYLEEADAPPDLPATAAEPGPELERVLDGLGVRP